MVVEHADTTKFPDEGIPYKYTNAGIRWVSATISSKLARRASNTTTLTLSRILFTFLDDDAEEIDDEEDNANIILSSQTMVIGLEG